MEWRTKGLTTDARRKAGLLVAMTEVTPPLDRAGVPDLPEPAGDLAGRRPGPGATACVLVHLHYLTAVPVSEAPGTAAGTGKALPDCHYRPAAGDLNWGLEEHGREGLPPPNFLHLLVFFLLIPSIPFHP